MKFLGSTHLKLFCRNKSDADKIFIAVKQWLNKRLKLEISEEKSNVVNLKRHYSEFLGFQMKAVKKRKGYTVRSHMNPKALKRVSDKLVEQIKIIQHTTDRKHEEREVIFYNSMIWGIHNYYGYATGISLDCDVLHRRIRIVTKNRLKRRLSKKGKIGQPYVQEKYGKSRQIRFVGDMVFCPIGYIRCKTPMFKKKKVCKYTVKGRIEIHNNLKFDTSILMRLMRINEHNRSIEFADNRISLYAAQNGRCAITSKVLELNEIHCHHKIPLSMGCTDKYLNLVIVHENVHILVHSTHPETISAYQQLIKLDKAMLSKLNKLRKLVGNEEI